MHPALHTPNGIWSSRACQRIQPPRYRSQAASSLISTIMTVLEAQRRQSLVSRTLMAKCPASAFMTFRTRFPPSKFAKLSKVKLSASGIVSHRLRHKLSNTQSASSKLMEVKLHRSRKPYLILPWSLVSSSWAVQVLHTALALPLRLDYATRLVKLPLSLILRSARPHAQLKTKKERACGSGLS